MLDDEAAPQRPVQFLDVCDAETGEPPLEFLAHLELRRTAVSRCKRNHGGVVWVMVAIVLEQHRLAAALRLVWSAIARHLPPRPPEALLRYMWGVVAQFVRRVMRTCDTK